MKKIFRILLGISVFAILVVVGGSQIQQLSQITDMRVKQAEFMAAIKDQRSKTDIDIKEVAAQLGKLNENLSSFVERTDQTTTENTARMLGMVEQQTALLYRSLGKEIPIQIPNSTRDALAAFEKRVADKKGWPKNQEEAQLMVNELGEVLEKIPTWAEADLMPRINAIRWNVQSLYLIKANANASGPVVGDIADALENQLAGQPKSASSAISSDMNSMLMGIREKIEDNRFNSAITEAKEQIEMKTMTNGLAVWERLAEWPLNPAALELRKKLRSRIISDDVEQFVINIREKLKRFREIQDDSFRLAALYNTLEKVTAQRLIVVDEEGSQEKSLKSLAELSSETQELVKSESKKEAMKAELRNRQYQKYALIKIAHFNSDLAIAKDRSRPSNGIFGGEEKFIDYLMIVDSMGRNLLPISPGYLDTAVAKQYAAAFEEGWEMLSGKNEKPQQTKVAEMEAYIAKKTPLNFEDMP